MPSAEENFKNHQVHQQITQQLEFIDAHSSQFVDEDAQAYFVTFKELLLYSENVLSRVISSIVPPNVMHGLASALNEFSAEINNYINSKNILHLGNADARGETILSLISVLPKLDDSANSDFYNKVISALKSDSKKILTDLKNRADSFAKQVVTLETFNAKNEEELKALSNEIKAQKTSLDGLAANFTNQFSQAQDERSKTFHESLLKQREVFDGQKSTLQAASEASVTEFENRKKQLFDKFTKESQAIIEEMIATRDEAKKLLKITADIVVTGNFKNIADTEHDTANMLRKISIGCMAAMIGVAVLPSLYHLLHGDGLNEVEFWKNILFRLPVSFLFLIPAIYTAKESEKHRKTELKNRQIELKLSAIDPYLASVEATKREEIKIGLTDNFFGGKEDEPEEKEQDIILTPDLVGLMKELVSVFKK